MTPNPDMHPKSSSPIFTIGMDWRPGAVRGKNSRTPQPAQGLRQAGRPAWHLMLEMPVPPGPFLKKTAGFDRVRHAVAEALDAMKWRLYDARDWAVALLEPISMFTGNIFSQSHQAAKMGEDGIWLIVNKYFFVAWRLCESITLKLRALITVPLRLRASCFTLRIPSSISNFARNVISRIVTGVDWALSPVFKVLDNVFGVVYHDLQIFCSLMVLERVKKGVRKVLQLGALVGALALPVKSTATDFYNTNVKIDWTNEVFSRNIDFYGRHNIPYTEEFDNPGDTLANLEPGPPGYTKIVAYTDTSAGMLYYDSRGIDSLTDYGVKIRYMSDTTPNFNGRSQIRFNFNNLIPSEKINSNMFYWGEFILPAEFSTNGVEKVDKKAMLSNLDTNRDVYFNLDGITNVVSSNDFNLLRICRTPNSFYFSQPSDGSVAVSNTSTSSSVTNTQRFAYDTMTNSEFNVKVDANEGRHLRGLEVVLQDINTGDFKTNSFSFPTNAPYTNSFSTNVVGAAGSNSVRNVQFGTNQYPLIFRDTHNNVDVTNTISHGDSFTTNFPLHIYKDNNPGSGTRYEARSIISDGVEVQP